MKNSLNHPQINFGKTGVLIINLGTPDSTNWFDIRKYLKEFLSDRRVIEVNPIIWQIILNVIILNLRPSKTAKAYKEIWMKEENISPLLYYTKKQAEKRLDRTAINVATGYRIRSALSLRIPIEIRDCDSDSISDLVPRRISSNLLSLAVASQIQFSMATIQWYP